MFRWTAAKSWFLRLLLTTWHLAVVKRTQQAFKSEVTRLQNKVGKQTIWEMKKEDLIQLAEKELGLTRSQAEKETVITLREKLRREKALMLELQEPLARLPKGLERMSVDELVQECETRGLDTTPLPGQRTPHKTRPQMILMIREQVELFTSNLPTPPAPIQNTATSSRHLSPKRSNPIDGDWEMEGGVR